MPSDPRLDALLEELRERPPGGWPAVHPLDRTALVRWVRMDEDTRHTEHVSQLGVTCLTDQGDDDEDNRHAKTDWDPLRLTGFDPFA
jgi:hypothetical protein